MMSSTTLPVRIEAHLQDKLREMFAPARAAAAGDTAALHEMRVATRRLRVSLRYFAALLESTEPGVPIRSALRTALLDFNTFDDSEAPRHRQRMRVILQTAELQAYSMTMYAGWRAVVADFVARRTLARPGDLAPQTIAWLMLGVALSAYEYWLVHDNVPLRLALGEAFDTAAVGLP